MNKKNLKAFKQRNSQRSIDHMLLAFEKILGYRMLTK